ncbi:MAG: hypothetical protein VCC00_04480 [Deltaproteobacteria bacterium]
MQGGGMVEEAATEREATPLPITLALLVWATVALVLVGAAILGGQPPV